MVILSLGSTGCLNLFYSPIHSTLHHIGLNLQVLTTNVEIIHLEIVHVSITVPLTLPGSVQGGHRPAL